MFVYCARCNGSRLRPDKGSGETLEDVHRRAIAPYIKRMGVTQAHDRER